MHYLAFIKYFYGTTEKLLSIKYSLLSIKSCEYTVLKIECSYEDLLVKISSQDFFSEDMRRYIDNFRFGEI